MWKRPEDPASPAVATPAAIAAPGAASPARAAAGTARLGPSLSWVGTLAGEEDLLVEGRFKGEIQLPGHQVTVGAAGLVEGEVRASSIVVEGEVRGNLTAAQEVLVRASGRVQGDIHAPRVALDQGCRFKGAIDMEPRGDAPARRESRDERPPERPVERPALRERPAAAAAG